eukprot:2067785-Rhodomonas_salina.1
MHETRSIRRPPSAIQRAGMSSLLEPSTSHSRAHWHANATRCWLQRQSDSTRTLREGAVRDTHSSAGVRVCSIRGRSVCLFLVCRRLLAEKFE